jgi:hypothetical protein
MPQSIPEQHQATPLRRSDYYDKIRSHIDAEDQLSNMRVIWLLIAEAFFVGGYATLLNAQETPKNALFGFQQDLLLWIIPVAALLGALLALAGVLASMKRVHQLQRYYERYELRTRDEDHSTDAYPPLHHGHEVDRLANLSMLGLPLLFVMLWGMIVVIQCVYRFAIS